LEKPQQNPTLTFRHLGGWQPFGNSQFGSTVLSIDFWELFFLVSDLLLIGVKGLEKFFSEVVRLRQRPLPFLWPLHDGRGIRAEKCRGGGNNLTAVYGEVQREVVSLHAPAPFAGPRGRAEDGEEVPFGVANQVPSLLQFAQDRLQAHDGGCLGVATETGAG